MCLASLLARDDLLMKFTKVPLSAASPSVTLLITSSLSDLANADFVPDDDCSGPKRGQQLLFSFQGAKSGLKQQETACSGPGLEHLCHCLFSLTPCPRLSLLAQV